MPPAPAPIITISNVGFARVAVGDIAGVVDWLQTWLFSVLTGLMALVRLPCPFYPALDLFASFYPVLLTLFALDSMLDYENSKSPALHAQQRGKGDIPARLDRKCRGLFQLAPTRAQWTQKRSSYDKPKTE